MKILWLELISDRRLIVNGVIVQMLADEVFELEPAALAVAAEAVESSRVSFYA